MKDENEKKRVDLARSFNDEDEEKKKYFNYNKYYYSFCDLETNINQLLKGKNVYEFPEFYLMDLLLQTYHDCLQHQELFH